LRRYTLYSIRNSSTVVLHKYNSMKQNKPLNHISTETPRYNRYIQILTYPLRRSPGVRFVEKHAISSGVTKLSVDLFQYFVRGLPANSIAQLWLVTIPAISKRHITLDTASIVLGAIYEGMTVDVREKLSGTAVESSGWEICINDGRKGSKTG